MVKNKIFLFALLFAIACEQAKKEEALPQLKKTHTEEPKPIHVIKKTKKTVVKKENGKRAKRLPQTKAEWARDIKRRNARRERIRKQQQKIYNEIKDMKQL